MAGLTGIVWVKLYYDRIGEINERKLKPDDLANKVVSFERVKASDNFKNLFEVPVLFYALIPALVATGNDSPGMVKAAWAYVGLRSVHSFIHCTYNKVRQRFGVYAISTMVLAGMWANFAMAVLND